jgi:signal transduction histidine kinase
MAQSFVSLHTGEGLPAQVEENVRIIHESVELEVQLIDDLLDLTKISRNKLKLNLQEVSVHEILGRTLQIVAHEVNAKHLTITCHLHATADTLTGDPARYCSFIILCCCSNFH